MTGDLLEIPPQMDRRPNGRCRAYWMAWEACPPKNNPHDWAVKHWEDHWAKAKKLDAKDGPVPACKPLKGRPPPPRTRTRKVDDGKRQERLPGEGGGVVEAPAPHQAVVLEKAPPGRKKGGKK